MITIVSGGARGERLSAYRKVEHERLIEIHFERGTAVS